jgi:hypothetical protein
MAPDPLTAELDAIEHRQENGSLHEFVTADSPRLLAALRKVLKPHQPGARVVLGNLCDHHEVCRHFSITATEAAGVMACTDCKADVYQSCTGCGTHVSVDKCPVRTAITRELLSKEADHG